MATDKSYLPYFKFEPIKWITGDIQICSKSTKGEFVDLCCHYWSRVGDVTIRMAKVRCGEIAYEELVTNGIVHEQGDKVVIKFMDEQLNVFNVKSKSMSDNAKSRWEETPERIKGEQIYVIRCWGPSEEFIKIGITDTSINRRYSGKMPYNFEAIVVELCEGSSQVEQLYESIAKRTGREYTPKQPFAGKLECYTIECMPDLIAFAKVRNANYMRNNASREEEIKEESKKPNSKPTIEERKAEFYKLLTPHVEKYGKDLLREFYNYWTEHGPKDRKMRFEKEKSFDPEKRLATWKKNETKFGLNGKPKVTWA